MRNVFVSCVLAAATAAMVGAMSVVSTAQTPSGQTLAERGLLFQPSSQCMTCHNGVSTPSGEDVSFGTLWRASMMAHSARDPYWQAGVRREVTDHPRAQAAIENECSRCHMPMAHVQTHDMGGQQSVFANLGGAWHRRGRRSARGRGRVLLLVSPDQGRSAWHQGQLHRRGSSSTW
jgi:hypothetical protein